jgi:hypothetical protein
MAKFHDTLKTASPIESTRQYFRVTVYSWRASALPSRLLPSFLLLLPLLIRSLLCLFLGIPLVAVLLLFFIHLLLVIDSMLIRLSWIGRMVCVHPGSESDTEVKIVREPILSDAATMRGGGSNSILLPRAELLPLLVK